MPQTPSTRWLVRDVISQVREVSGTSQLQTLVTNQGRYIYQTALMEVYALLNISNVQDYLASQVLTGASSGAIFAAADFKVATLSLEGIDFSTSAVVGKTAIFIDSGVAYIGTITKVELNYTATNDRLTLAGSSLPAGNLTGLAVYIVSSTDPAAGYDISTLLFDHLITLEDSNVGLCTQVSPQQFGAQRRADFEDGSYAQSIVWAQYANKIRVKNGSGVTAGTKTLWYKRLPNIPASNALWDTDYVDMSDKFIPLVVNRMLAQIYTSSGQDIPANFHQAMQADYQSILGLSESDVRSKLDTVLKGRTTGTGLALGMTR
jgi:hypothetical protein